VILGKVLHNIGDRRFNEDNLLRLLVNISLISSKQEVGTQFALVRFSKGAVALVRSLTPKMKGFQ